MRSLNKYYKVLNIPENATKEEIKNAYKKLAKKWHPDNFTNNIIQQDLATEKFVCIHEAYQILIRQNENISPINEHLEVKIKSKKDVYNLAKYYYNLAVLAVEKEDWQEAIYYFNSAININNHFAEAYFYRATILEKLGFNLRAEADYNQFNQLRRKSPYNYKKSTKVNNKRNYEYLRVFSVKHRLNIKNTLIFIFYIGLFILLLFTLL
jgi:curved DNA-binding protein CbpA